MLEPRFLKGSQGPLFALSFLPSGQTPENLQGRHVVHVPAFAEEMNKSRHMVARQACEFAHAGLGVTVLDLHGTGDSGGDFAEARWELWLADLAALVAELRARGVERVSLWGLRLGALLALEAIARLRGPVDHLVLWQPVVSGQQAMNQFLRLRMAAGLRGEGGGESVKGLRQRLAAGESLEVAGYTLNPELVAAVDRAALDGAAPASGVRADWLEVQPSGRTGLSPASQRVVDAWRDTGVDLEVRSVPGEPFWTTQEIASAPQLVSATRELFHQRVAAGEAG